MHQLVFSETKKEGNHCNMVDQPCWYKLTQKQNQPDTSKRAFSENNNHRHLLLLLSLKADNHLPSQEG